MSRQMGIERVRARATAGGVLLVLASLGGAAGLAEGRPRTGADAAAARSGSSGGDGVERPSGRPSGRGEWRGGSRHHHGHHRSWSYGRSRWYGYPYSFYSPWWWHWGPAAYVAVAPQWSPTHGALDIDIAPERARVYVNGELAGIADNFDGFPRYLWLEEGDYRLVFHLEGYRTVVHEYTVRAGEVRELDWKLEPGETTPPEQLFEKKERAVVAAPAPRDGAGDAANSARAVPTPERSESPRARASSSADARRPPGRLSVRIEPADAAVYLDGRFLGSGEELARLHAGLLVDAGEHTLEVVRPGYRTKVVPFEVGEGDETSVSALLERE